MKIEDYNEVYRLWLKCNIPVSKSDEKEDIERFIKLNPETSLVGIIDGKIIATVLGGFDGRRGIVHHLAVDCDYRNKGCGYRILEKLEETIKGIGTHKINLWVKKDNLQVLKFYERLGYILRDDIVTMSKVL